MTEMSEDKIKLTSAMEKFILRWGEMGSAWGVNRTVAQIYALLYLSPRPLTAEEIGEALAVARSTVSTGLHELQSWEIVKIVHVLGDRRDHFEAMRNVSEMFRAILRERKSREIDPLVATLRASLADLGEGDAAVRGRMQSMLDFLEGAMAVYEQIDQMPTEVLLKLFRMRRNLPKILDRAARE